MVSLTTVYILSVLIVSMAGMGSAFAGNKMAGGGIISPPVSEPVPEPVQEEAVLQPSTEQTVPVVASEQTADMGS
jgi:hypothetical protein